MEKAKNERNELLEWIKALVIAFGLAFLIRYVLFTPTVVNGESMMPTLENGERMVVNKIRYELGEPKRFDIIVFHATEEKDYVKRVIGLPGDHIEYKDDQLFVNGEVMPEPYLAEYKEEISSGTLTEDFTLEDYTQLQTIPTGYVFVLGDNRRKSTDSRIFGLVPVNEIIGKTNVVFWPPKEIRLVE